MDAVPEVIGAPSPVGAVVVTCNNRPEGKAENQLGVRAPKDRWYIPSHCPVFQSQESPDRHGIRYVTAFQPQSVSGVELWNQKVAGVSIDGQYNVEQLRANAGCEGQTQLSIAVGGMVSLASSDADNKKFKYGDIVRVVTGSFAKVERLYDTDFEGPLRYDLIPETMPSVGTFVRPVGPEGGMVVMLNFDL